MKRAITFALICALLVATMATTLVIGAFIQPQTFRELIFARRLPRLSLIHKSSGKSNVEIVNQANQSVVIVIATRAPRAKDPSTVNEWSTPSESNVMRGTGTGFFIDPEGYIVTNEHVIKGADRIRVKLADGRELKAVVKGVDLGTDLALLKVDANNLNPLMLGDSDLVRVGDPVIAIGNPLEYEHSVTAGIVSAKNRKIYLDKPYLDFIQTDAAINRGNSGGPLLNQVGEVIAVNTVIRVDGRGISFAVPINLVKQVVAQLRAYGFVARGYLGLTPATITPEFREGLGLGEVKGILVADVMHNKPAARAGIQIYDVITHLNGRAITRTDDFYGFVANTPPLHNLELTVIRSGQQLKLLATLMPRDDDDRPSWSPPILQKTGLSIGFSVRENTPQNLRQLRVGKLDEEVSGGVVISEIDPLGPAADSHLAVGQIILEANRQQIRKLEDFNQVTMQLRQGSALVLRVKSSQQKDLRLVAIRIGEL
jgi:serine protease Do